RSAFGAPSPPSASSAAGFLFSRFRGGRWLGLGQWLGLGPLCGFFHRRRGPAATTALGGRFRGDVLPYRLRLGLLSSPSGRGSGPGFGHGSRLRASRRLRLRFESQFLSQGGPAVLFRFLRVHESFTHG